MINVREKTKQQTNKKCGEAIQYKFSIEESFCKSEKHSILWNRKEKKPKYEAKIKQDITAKHLWTRGKKQQSKKKVYK